MNIDELILDLKGAALKASPGAWSDLYNSGRIYSLNSLINNGFVGAMSTNEDSVFVALANPKNILELCEYIEKLKEK